MSPPILLDIYRARTEGDGRIIASLPVDRADSSRIADLDDLARACLDYPLMMKRLNDRLFDRIVAESIVEPTELSKLGEMFRETFDKSLQVLNSVVDRIHALPATGVANAAQLERAKSELEELRQTIFDPWPFLWAEDEDRCRSEIARGEFEEFGRELSNTHS